MNLSQNNIKIKKQKDKTRPKIEEKLILLKIERENLLKEFKDEKNIANTNNNNAPYYSNVIKRQKSHSPNNSILLHEFLDNKKFTYKDITNKIDKDELSSKIKNIVINTQRIKSCGNIFLNKPKPKVYLRKTKSSFSCRQTNSSFTSENESKNLAIVKNICVNKNINYRNKQRFIDTFSFNLNLNNLYNKYNNGNKTYENGKYYNKTLREYLNEQVKNIKTKRNNLNEINMSNNFENDHNYSIDNENKELLDKEENILNEINELLVLSNTKKNSSSKNEKILVSSTDNKSKNLCKIKIKNLEEKIDYNNNKKLSNYLSFKKNNISNIKRNLKDMTKKKLNNNTFRNSNIKLNLTKFKSSKNLNSNNNIKTKNSQYINYNKLYDFILPKPLTNINMNNINKKKTSTCKSISMLNIDKINNIEGNENINIINICNTKDKVTKTIKKNACKNKKYNNT